VDGSPAIALHDRDHPRRTAVEIDEVPERAIELGVGADQLALVRERVRSGRDREESGRDREERASPRHREK